MSKYVKYGMNTLQSYKCILIVKYKRTRQLCMCNNKKMKKENIHYINM